MVQSIAPDCPQSINYRHSLLALHLLALHLVAGDLLAQRGVELR